MMKRTQQGRNLMMIKVIMIMLFSVTVAFGQDNKTQVIEVGSEKLINAQELMTSLREKEKALNTKESDLNAKEAMIRTLESDVVARENDLKRLRQDVSDKINELKTLEDAEVDKLASVYSSTKAKSAAAIIVKMDLKKAADIVRRMSPMAAGRLMNEMAKIDPNYAARLGEALTPQTTFELP